MSSSSSSTRSNKGNKNKSNKGGGANTEQLPGLQLIIREKGGWRLMKQDRKSGKLQQQSATKACSDADIVFSDDGEYFAVLLEEGMEIYESFGGRKLCYLEHFRVRNVYFSPNNTYIVSYHHRRATDKHGNCWVWKWDPSSDSNASAPAAAANDDASNGNAEGEEGNDEQKSSKAQGGSRVVFQFFLPEFDKKRRPLQFSDDEFVAARITRNAVLVHDARRLHYKSNNIIGKLDVVNVASVVVAPCQQKSSSSPSSSQGQSQTKTQAQNSYLCAVFALPKNNKAATVTIYEYQYALAMNKKSNTSKLFTKIAQRAFFGADHCELLWDATNSYHHNLLAIASSDVDTSGKSYYGNQTLFLLSSRNNFTAKVDISDQGKLQDVAWHPYGKEFVMIDDHPQKITICDFRGQKAHALGHYARNLIRFSGDGRFLWCGGFGNLTGEMTFYDYKNIKNDESLACLGYNTDDACRYFEWSPDATSFLTARLYPYMTVDNGFRIYKYNGQRLYEESVERLYQIAYRPNAKGTYPARSVSPAARKKAKPIPKAAAKKRYVPPHMRSASDKEKVADAPPQTNQRAQQPRQQPQPRRQPQPRQQQPQQQPQPHPNHTHASQMPYQQQQQMPPRQQQQRQHPQQPQYPHQPPYAQQQQQQPYHQQQVGATYGQPAYNGAGFQPHAYQQHAYQQQPPQQRKQQQQQATAVAGNQHQYNSAAGSGNMQSGQQSHPEQAQPGQGQGQGQGPAQAVDEVNNEAAENGVDGDGKKKRKRGRKNKKAAGANLVNTAASSTSSSSSQLKPGLHDNKRWARGSKYTE